MVLTCTGHRWSPEQPWLDPFIKALWCQRRSSESFACRAGSIPNAADQSELPSAVVTPSRPVASFLFFLMAQLNRLIHIGDPLWICDYHLAPLLAHHCFTALPLQTEARTFIIHRNQISGGESYFSLSRVLLCFLYFLVRLFSLSLHLSCGRIAFIATNILWSLWLTSAAASHWCWKSEKQAARPVRKMSNSLIVIMCLCHLPIIGMI